GGVLPAAAGGAPPTAQTRSPAGIQIVAGSLQARAWRSSRRWPHLLTGSNFMGGHLRPGSQDRAAHPCASPLPTPSTVIGPTGDSAASMVVSMDGILRGFGA